MHASSQRKRQRAIEVGPNDAPVGQQQNIPPVDVSVEDVRGVDRMEVAEGGVSYVDGCIPERDWLRIFEVFE